jgi:hypothetical protein
VPTNRQARFGERVTVDPAKGNRSLLNNITTRESGQTSARSFMTRNLIKRLRRESR